MKILMLVHKFWPSVGGTQTLSLNLARRLTARGHEVVVFTSKARASPTEEWNEGIHIRRFSTQNVIVSRPWYITPGMIPSAMEIASNHSFDLIHAFHFVTFQSLLGALLRKFGAMPFVLNPSFHPWEGIYERSIAPLIMKNAQALIAQCNQERHYLLRFVNSTHIHEIPCGIDSASFAQTGDRKEFRAKIGFDFSDKIMLYMGSVGSRKSVEELIRIMPNVLRRVPKAKLLLVGLGSDNESLNSLGLTLGVSHAVKSLDRISDLEILEAYGASDVFVFASKNESFGIVLLEAAAAGLPIVSTPVGIAPEIISNGETGYICAGCDIEFLERVVQVLSDDRFKESALNRRKLVYAKYDWDNVVKSLESVYAGVI